MEPTEPILDPVIALTFAAAVTSRVRLGTGVIILPQRNPLVLAKELASLDVLSGGRLIFGLGVGYLAPEFAALGVPLAQHGPRSDDYVAAMRAIWSETAPAHAGRFVSFSGVNAYPRPIQRPVPPLVVGGRSPAAYRRSVAQGHGWYGFGMDPTHTATALAGLAAAATEVARPSELGRLEISITPPPGELDLTTAAQYAALGVDRLIVRPPKFGDEAAYLRCIDRLGALVGRV